MASNLPCPNPACTHVFTPGELKGATQVKCPRCGTLFKFRTSPGGSAEAGAKPGQPNRPMAPSVSPARPPLAKPVGPNPRTIPVAPPSAPLANAPPSGRSGPPRRAMDNPFADEPLAGGPPVELPPEAPLPPEGDPFAEESLAVDDDGRPLVRTRRPQKKSGGRALIFSLLALVMVAGAVGGYFLLRDRFLPGGGESDPRREIQGKVKNLRNAEEKAFVLRLPLKDTWTAAPALKSGLKAQIALEKTNPDIWLAVLARDYGTRKPRDAELVKEAIDRLEGNFGETLELGANPVGREVLGEPARCVEFKGQTGVVVWRGEVWTFTHHGLGYWIFAGAPTLQQAQEALIDLVDTQKALAFADERRGWSEQPPKLESFAAEKLPLSLKAQEGVWEKLPNAQDVDEKGELALYGRYLGERDKKDNSKNAEILVLALDKQADLKTSLKFAWTYLEEKRKEQVQNFNLAPVLAEDGETKEMKEDGVEGKVGNADGWIVDLRGSVGDEPRRFIQLAVVHADNQAVAIVCECAWGNRQIWRQDFRDLLATMRVRKG